MVTGRPLRRLFAHAKGPATNGTETISTIPVLGGPERMVGPGFANDWSPDGTVILVLFVVERQPASLHLVSVGDGSARRLITTPPGSTLHQGRFSPDGRKVFYVEQTAPAESYLNEVDVAGDHRSGFQLSGSAPSITSLGSPRIA